MGDGAELRELVDGRTDGMEEGRRDGIGIWQ